MTGEYEPREHDHLIEPMIDAVHGQEDPSGPAEVAPGSPSRAAAWAPLLVPLGGFAIAILVWSLWRLFGDA